MVDNSIGLHFSHGTIYIIPEEDRVDFRYVQPRGIHYSCSCEKKSIVGYADVLTRSPAKINVDHAQNHALVLYTHPTLDPLILTLERTSQHRGGGSKRPAQPSIDDMQKEIDVLKAELAQQKEEMAELRGRLLDIARIAAS